MLESIDPLPSLSQKLKWEGPFSFLGKRMATKKSRTWQAQRELLITRALEVSDEAASLSFLKSENYYRFSGYARYFQKAPHYGDDNFKAGTTFDEIRDIYDADEALRSALSVQLARAELLLRSHFAYVVAHEYGPYRRYLEEDFYLDFGNAERTVISCLRDLRRSRERHILRFRVDDETGEPIYSDLPVWSAVEAWSFGTLSKCIERGAVGSLEERIAASLGVAQKGFALRVRSLVYLRNRCAHQSRLWHHSVIDAGPTPNNVRVKAKKVAGQFEPRAVLDVIASLDDLVVRGGGGPPILPQLVAAHKPHAAFWDGLLRPQNPRDHQE